MKKNLRLPILAGYILASLFLITSDLCYTSMIPAGGDAAVKLPNDPPMIALTFDDGPKPETTIRLLDALALREIPATFFLVGEFIPGNEPLIKRMVSDGHQIGVHSYSHIEIVNLSRSDFDFEVTQTRDLLRDILGEGQYWLRPPYGILDDSVLKWADSPIILWSLDPEDWKDRDVQRITDDVLNRVRDGDILLFHDIYNSSVDAVIQITDALLDRGYCFVTVEQLLKSRNISLENGRIYRSAQ